MSKQRQPLSRPETPQDSGLRPPVAREPAMGSPPFRTAGIPRTGQQPTTEIDAMLQARLRAAGLFFSVVLALTLLRDLLYRNSVAWQLQVAAILAISTCVVLLSASRNFKTRWLRLGEAIIFGMTAGVLALRLYHAMLAAASHGDLVDVVASSKNMLITSILLMFAHALFIPGTWQRAFRFALGFSALPIATLALLLMTHPKFFTVLQHVASVERIARDLGLLVIAGALSVYGTHILGVLRREAFEAKRLNQYQLRGKIAGGGMGDVYLAEHQLLKRPCAIKLIRPDRAEDPKALARFEREVRAMARLSHPNIVDIYDYGAASDGTFYYVMEYLQGMTLEELAGLHGPQPAGRVIYLLRQACDALTEAHEAGLIHRDIKPANLFAAKQGGRYDFLKLLDFGLVKEKSVDSGTLSLRQTHTPPGTPQFMAPEQISGDHPIDPRTDLYALGGVAYLLLTGRAAFEGDTAAAVMIAATRDPVVPPSRIKSNVPEDLERVILRCLAKDPAQRYANASELEQAFAACVAAREWDAAASARWWQKVGFPSNIKPTA